MSKRRIATPTYKEGVLVVVPCGKRKLWDENWMHYPAEARDAYTSTLFRLHRRYAELHGDTWMILSAFYGLIRPTRVIEDYDKKLDPKDFEFGPGDLVSDRRSLLLGGYASSIQKQAGAETSILRDSHGLKVRRVVLLGGKLYRALGRHAFRHTFPAPEFVEPFAGLDLFETMAALKVHTT